MKKPLRHNLLCNRLRVKAVRCGGLRRRAYQTGGWRSSFLPSAEGGGQEKALPLKSQTP
jgi:hypothetical protein